MIDIELNVKISEVLAATKTVAKTNVDEGVRFIGSGKAGIGLVLSYLGKGGILENKICKLKLLSIKGFGAIRLFKKKPAQKYEAIHCRNSCQAYFLSFAG